MTRPIKRRFIGFNPSTTYFKPRAVPLSSIEEIEIGVDEMEALRLCDYKGLSQVKASKKMKISQSTLQRILDSARRKMAEALAEGKAIKIIKN